MKSTKVYFYFTREAQMLPDCRSVSSPTLYGTRTVDHFSLFELVTIDMLINRL